MGQNLRDLAISKQRVKRLAIGQLHMANGFLEVSAHFGAQIAEFVGETLQGPFRARRFSGGRLSRSPIASARKMRFCNRH
ncbi:MAG: hypothetical protein AAFX86_12545 [Pseudomonadota bacterium]